MNGGDVSEGRNLGAGLIPNLDSVEEFRLITNSFDAEYGKFSGAVMNAITKSGTNDFHGDVFEFLRNDASMRGITSRLPNPNCAKINLVTPRGAPSGRIICSSSRITRARVRCKAPKPAWLPFRPRRSGRATLILRR